MKLYSFLNNLIDDIDPVWKPISEENEWQNNDSEYQYGKRGNLPQTSCLMSTNEYFDTALNSPNIIIDNIRQGFWQYSKHNSVALLNNINILINLLKIGPHIRPHNIDHTRYFRHAPACLRIVANICGFASGYAAVCLLRPL